MNTLEERIDFVRAGMGVQRYHQRYTHSIDTVGKHSAGVALWLILMNGDKLPSAQLLAAALVHDLPEWVVGDIPAPAKRAMSSDARADLACVEDRVLKDHGFDYDLTDNEWRQLKLADYFDGLMFCVEEKRRGNREVFEVGEKYIDYLYGLLYRTSEVEPREESTPLELKIFEILVKKWRNA